MNVASNCDISEVAKHQLLHTGYFRQYQHDFHAARNLFCEHKSTNIIGFALLSCIYYVI